MSPAPTAATRVLAILGDPVSHSLSPVFQNAAIAAAGLDGVYVALRCPAGEAGPLLRALARAGGGGNVTVPHKEEAARAVDRRTESVEATGACNTFWAQDGEVWGDNTDVEGVRGAVEALLGRSPAGLSCVVVGAGGSARAAVHALLTEGARRVVVLNRTRERAEALADALSAGGSVEVASDARELAGEEFGLALNATSLGLKDGDALPLSMDGGARCAAALDLVYARGGTPWVRALREAGVPAADGREVLLLQGAAAFRRWWRREPPLEAMRAALAAPGVE